MPALHGQSCWCWVCFMWARLKWSWNQHAFKQCGTWGASVFLLVCLFFCFVFPFSLCLSWHEVSFHSFYFCHSIRLRFLFSILPTLRFFIHSISMWHDFLDLLPIFSFWPCESVRRIFIYVVLVTKVIFLWRASLFIIRNSKFSLCNPTCWVNQMFESRDSC